MTTAYTIRAATVDDAETITQQRASMFLAMGVDATKVEAQSAPFLAWVSEKLVAGEYLGWLAVSSDGQVVAGAGMWLNDWFPSPLAANIRRGYILNVFTEPEHRGQGLARRLVEEALAYCRAHEIAAAVLHASDAGRPIYERIGFTQTNEMRLILMD